jgi:hypothetical protein
MSTKSKSDVDHTIERTGHHERLDLQEMEQGSVTSRPVHSPIFLAIAVPQFVVGSQSLETREAFAFMPSPKG